MGRTVLKTNPPKIPRSEPVPRLSPCQALCYGNPTMIHENLSQSIEDLSARIIAIRDSLWRPRQTSTPQGTRSEDGRARLLGQPGGGQGHRLGNEGAQGRR